MTKHYPDLMLYIGGSWRKTTEALPVLNPADETVIGHVAGPPARDPREAREPAAERGGARGGGAPVHHQ